LPWILGDVEPLADALIDGYDNSTRHSLRLWQAIAIQSMF